MPRISSAAWSYRYRCGLLGRLDHADGVAAAVRHARTTQPWRKREPTPSIYIYKKSRYTNKKKTREIASRRWVGWNQMMGVCFQGLEHARVRRSRQATCYISKVFVLTPLCQYTSKFQDVLPEGVGTQYRTNRRIHPRQQAFNFLQGYNTIQYKMKDVKPTPSGELKEEASTCRGRPVSQA